MPHSAEKPTYTEPWPRLQGSEAAECLKKVFCFDAYNLLKKFKQNWDHATQHSFTITFEKTLTYNEEFPMWLVISVAS